MFCGCGRSKEKTMDLLKGITLEELQDCVEKWKKCLDKCLTSNGEYFEGDNFVNL